jgi:DNA-binding NarL/FixJ family response regulator
MTFARVSAKVELEIMNIESERIKGYGSRLMELSTLRVLIADDNRKAREGLDALVGTWPEVEIVGEVSDGIAVLLFLEEKGADVVLLDVRMPKLDGIETTREINRRWPEVKVVVLSMYPYARGEALDAGASAFFIKGESPQDIRAAIGAQASPK